MEKVFSAALAAFVAHRLAELAMSKEDLIRASGLGRQTVFDLAAGRRPKDAVHTHVVDSLARGLDVDPGAIAALLHGFGHPVEMTGDDDKDEVVQAFMVTTGADLTAEQLAQVLDVARAAVGLVKTDPPSSAKRPSGRRPKGRGQ